nr:unnamed protein product [Callosobruchus analis]
MKQTQKLKELLLNIAYRVLSAEDTGGLYSEQVILHLQDHSVYLPNRVTAVYKPNLDTSPPKIQLSLSGRSRLRPC